MAAGARGVGDFCWINMLTPQPGEARTFFGKVLGWTYAGIPGMGHRIQVGGRDIGGLFDLASPNTPKGTPPLIGVMMKVASADAACVKVAALGGKAAPPFDIVDQGRMAVCADPNGAEFDLWEPRKGPGTEADSNLHGAPSWFETMTTDVDRAAKFYSGVFGWSAEAMPAPDASYTSFKLGAEYIAGMMRITAQMGQLRPHWATYFTVADADAAVREAVALGGAIRVPAQDIPGVGRFGGLTSPQGVPFNVIQYSR